MAGLKELHDKENPIVFLDIRIGDENGRQLMAKNVILCFADNFL